jgi:hypothetical protein
MNNIHLVTYATHSDGLYENLINNKFNIKIDVLGWNTKWKGFYDKMIAMYDYSKKKPQNDIIIFLDGFDSEINKNIDEKLITKFKSFNCDILISRDTNITNPICKYIINKKYKNKKSTYIGNSGMYMGYSKHLVKLLDTVIKLNLDDDQVAFNKCMYNFNYKIDINSIIFKNIIKDIDKKNEYFTSYPGGAIGKASYKYTINRFYRGIKENLFLLTNEIIIIITILVISIAIIKKSKVF